MGPRTMMMVLLEEAAWSSKGGGKGPGCHRISSPLAQGLQKSLQEGTPGGRTPLSQQPQLLPLPSSGQLPDLTLFWVHSVPAVAPKRWEG